LGSGGIRGLLDSAVSQVRHVTGRQAWYELGWHWLTGLAVLLLADLVFAVPVWFRWLGLLALIAYPVFRAVVIRRTIVGREFPPEHAARLVEEGHPELNNALINAIQFERVVDSAPDAQAGLMRIEISRAQSAATTARVDRVVSRTGEHRARILLFSAAGIWIAACILLPGVVFTILPRLFAPWLDDITPPFSLTKIDLSPKGTSIRYGGNLTVNVALQGPIPESLTLATRSTKGDWTDTPLQTTEPGKYALTLSNLREDTWIMARGAGGWGGSSRSARYLVKVVQPPVAQSLLAAYTYPAYTGLKEFREAVGEEKGVHGLRGTKVRLEIGANRELTGGDLVLESEGAKAEHFPLQISDKDPKTAFAEFPITAPGTFHLALASGDAQVNASAASGKVTLEHDEHPNIWFNEPPSEIVVTPDMKVAVDVEADDDIGVARIDWHRVINGIADNAETLYSGEPIKKTGRRVEMDMADLGVRPGDEITYYADAYDNDPGHPNYAETEPYKITVVSAQDFKKRLKESRDAEQLAKEANDITDALASLAARQQELAEKMEKAAKALAANPNDAAAKKDMAAAQAEQKKLQAEAAEMAKKLEQYAKSPSASPIESALKEKIAEAAKNVAKAAGDPMKGAQSPSPPSAAKSAREAANELSHASGAAQKSVGEAIKNIEKVAPLYQDVEQFKALLDRQGQLVLQARQFENASPSDDAAHSKMEAIAEAQRQIADELKALQEDFRRHAADAAKDFPKAAASAVKIADEIGKRQIPNLMETSQGKFSQDQGPAGFSNAKKALEQMQAMMQSGDSAQGDGKSELDIKLSQSLGKPGLGQSLGLCMNPGVGPNGGSGVGSGPGGQMSGGTSKSGQGANQHGAVAYTMKMTDLSASSGTRKDRKPNRVAGSPAALSSDRIEMLPEAAKNPPKATDSATKGYPPEYRKMIRDYFISVTKEKKP